MDRNTPVGPADRAPGRVLGSLLRVLIALLAAQALGTAYLISWNLFYLILIAFLLPLSIWIWIVVACLWRGASGAPPDRALRGRLTLAILLPFILGISTYPLARGMFRFRVLRSERLLRRVLAAQPARRTVEDWGKPRWHPILEWRGGPNPDWCFFGARSMQVILDGRSTGIILDDRNPALPIHALHLGLSNTRSGLGWMLVHDPLPRRQGWSLQGDLRPFRERWVMDDYVLTTVQPRAGDMYLIAFDEQ